MWQHTYTYDLYCTYIRTLHTLFVLCGTFSSCHGFINAVSYHAYTYGHLYCTYILTLHTLFVFCGTFSSCHNNYGFINAVSYHIWTFILYICTSNAVYIHGLYFVVHSPGVIIIMVLLMQSVIKHTHMDIYTVHIYALYIILWYTLLVS